MLSPQWWALMSIYLIRRPSILFSTVCWIFLENKFSVSLLDFLMLSVCCTDDIFDLSLKLCMHLCFKMWEGTAEHVQWLAVNSKSCCSRSCSCWFLLHRRHRSSPVCVLSRLFTKLGWWRHPWRRASETFSRLSIRVWAKQCWQYTSCNAFSGQNLKIPFSWR